jgi:hypothetical protein
MAVSAESLQVSRVIVPSIPVNVVNVQLTGVSWLELAVLAIILLVCCVRIPAVDNVSAVDGITSVFAFKG